MANGQTGAGAPADVVVVAADADRLGQYDDAFKKARIASRATLDADEAEGLVGSLSPNVLVLDRGLPRLTLFRLYGLVREDPSETCIQIVFVGQEDDTGPGDHYLPGDPSPTNVAERVTQLLAGSGASPETAVADDAPVPVAAAPAPVAPVETARQTAPSASGVAATASTASAPVTNGVTSTAVADGPATAEAEAAVAEDAAVEAPPKSGRRLDVILIRVGLVLLILGALLILIQSDAYPPSLVAPGAAPATPTRRPAASPKPGAFLDGAGIIVSVVDSRR